jgi:hypothetical protein
MKFTTSKINSIRKSIIRATICTNGATSHNLYSNIYLAPIIALFLESVTPFILAPKKSSHSFSHPGRYFIEFHFLVAQLAIYITFDSGIQLFYYNISLKIS